MRERYNRGKRTSNIDILRKTLRDHNIPQEFYSIGDYVEEAVCLERDNSGWIVYEGERGKKHNIKSYTESKDACYDIICRVTETVEDEKKLLGFFDCECEKNVFVPKFTRNKRIRSIDRTEVLEIHLGSRRLEERQRACRKRSVAVLHNNVNEEIKVLVFAKGDKAIAAKKAGADYVGDERLVLKIRDEGWMDFDIIVATPDMMEVVRRLRKILGPKGLMPSYKAGTVTMNVEKTVRDIKMGKNKFKSITSNEMRVPIEVKSAILPKRIKVRMNRKGIK